MIFQKKYIPAELLYADDPLPDGFEYLKWRILRRIGAVGMLWNRNSPAFLGIREMDPETRVHAFEQLAEEGKIIRIHVEGISSRFYILSGDLDLLYRAKEPSLSRRLEFLAPLDPMLWDRKLIEKIFDYTYTWEIYVPKEKRQYGYYVLPILYGEKLIGRIEPVIKDGELYVRGLWLEKGVRKSKKLNHALNKRLKTFARFNNIDYREKEYFGSDSYYTEQSI